VTPTPTLRPVRLPLITPLAAITFPFHQVSIIQSKDK
jgi:hypothetical protein